VKVFGARVYIHRSALLGAGAQLALAIPLWSERARKPKPRRKFGRR
jgi:hypothetical protein